MKYLHRFDMYAQQFFFFKFKSFCTCIWFYFSEIVMILNKVDKLDFVFYINYVFVYLYIFYIYLNIDLIEIPSLDCHECEKHGNWREFSLFFAFSLSNFKFFLLNFFYRFHLPCSLKTIFIFSFFIAFLFDRLFSAFLSKQNFFHLQYFRF